jgi:hypothetical protein
MPVGISPFFKVPSKFFGSGTASSLGTSASILFLALCEHANRHDKMTFKASDKALSADTNLGRRTICNARKELVERGLVVCSRGEGQSFTYTIQKLSLTWVPLKNRLRKKQKPRAIHASRIGSPRQTLPGHKKPRLAKTNAQSA